MFVIDCIDIGETFNSSYVTIVQLVFFFSLCSCVTCCFGTCIGTQGKRINYINQMIKEESSQNSTTVVQDPNIPQV